MKQKVADVIKVSQDWAKRASLMQWLLKLAHVIAITLMCRFIFPSDTMILPALGFSLLFALIMFIQGAVYTNSIRICAIFITVDGTLLIRHGRRKIDIKPKADTPVTQNNGDWQITGEDGKSAILPVKAYPTLDKDIAQTLENIRLHPDWFKEADI